MFLLSKRMIVSLQIKIILHTEIGFKEALFIR